MRITVDNTGDNRAYPSVDKLDNGVDNGKPNRSVCNCLDRCAH